MGRNKIAVAAKDECPRRDRMPSCRLSYCAWHADADRRAGEGQRQKWCTVCTRYRWEQEVGVCPLAVLVDHRPGGEKDNEEER